MNPPWSNIQACPSKLISPVTAHPDTFTHFLWPHILHSSLVFCSCALRNNEALRTASHITYNTQASVIIIYLKEIIIFCVDPWLVMWSTVLSFSPHRDWERTPTCREIITVLFCFVFFDMTDCRSRVKTGPCRCLRLLKISCSRCQKLIASRRLSWMLLGGHIMKTL